MEPGSEVAARLQCAETGIGVDHRFLKKVLGIGVIAGHPHGVLVDGFEQRDHVGLKPCAEVAISRATCLCIEIYSAAC